jgi:hypothetical protein
MLNNDKICKEFSISQVYLALQSLLSVNSVVKQWCQADFVPQEQLAREYKTLYTLSTFTQCNQTDAMLDVFFLTK